MSGLEDLQVWRRCIALVRKIYDATRVFPRHELFGLTSQLRRAAVSVPSNIAEGHARNSTRYYARFVSHAQGSLSEVLTQMHIAVALEYTTAAATAQLFQELDEIARILNQLRRSLMQSVDESLIPNP